MPLFVTTIITLGATPTGFGVYPMTYVNETKSAVLARESAVADALASDPKRTIHDTATSRVPDAVVKAGVVQSVVATSAILTSQTRDGTTLTAFAHAGLGSAESAKEAAVVAAQKAHPDKSVAHVSSIFVPGDVLLRSAQQAEAREKGVGEKREVREIIPNGPAFDVEKFAESTINRYRQEALDRGPDRARTSVVYAVGQEALETKSASRAGATAVAAAAIDSYREHRHAKEPHIQARESAVAEIRQRFNEYGQDKNAPKKEREQSSAL